jgi:chromosome segregation ATPase
LQQQLKAREAAAARATASQRALAEELKSAQAAQAQQQARIAELEAALQAERRAAEQMQATLATRDRDLRQVRAALQDTGAMREACQQQVVAQERTLGECSAKNERLFKLNGELITRYRSKGVLDALRQSEPFLGLRDVELFNEVQEVRDRADAARHVPAARAP